MAIVTKGVEPASVLMAAAPPAWLEEWSAFAARLRFADLSAEVAQRSRLALLDRRSPRGWSRAKAPARRR